MNYKVSFNGISDSVTLYSSLTLESVICISMYTKMGYNNKYIGTLIRFDKGYLNFPPLAPSTFFFQASTLITLNVKCILRSESFNEEESSRVVTHSYRGNPSTPCYTSVSTGWILTHHHIRFGRTRSIQEVSRP